MTGESHSRPTQRISRFSQAYRTLPPDAEMRADFDRPAESVLSRAEDAPDASGVGRGSPQWQRYSPPEHNAEVIEVEFETVLPVVAAHYETHATAPAPNGAIKVQLSSAVPFEGTEDEADDSQPPPPDIEAIAAALAAEMDRNAALQSKPAIDIPPHQPQAEPQSEPTEPREPSPDALAFSAPESLQPAESAAPDAIETWQPEAAPVAQMASLGPAETKATDTRVTRALADMRHLAAQIRPLATQARQFARTNAGPVAANAGLWIARNLRRKEIRRRYGKALALVHGRLLDRRLEQHFFIPSLSAERFAPAAERAILYEGPVPAIAFNWVMSALPQDLREYAFVDFRAGLGRAMLLASHRRFERIIGYEYNGPGYDDLQMNIAQFPRSKMLCRDVQCHRGDRTGVSIPDQPCVLYIANAWREEFLGGIMTYLCDSYRHKPRRLFLILENVDEKLALPKSDIFYRLELPLAEKLKLRLFSPMDFQVYRTLA
jgi:hypothetical protein